MPDLRIGTCSWKYPSWRGVVYPADGEFDYLQEYARRFDTVEVDQWFWSLFPGDKVALPKAGDVAMITKAVPAGFRFTVKVPDSITLTHFRRREKSAPLQANPHFLSSGLYGEFLARLEPLRGKIGALMLQFEYLNRQKMKSRSAFQDRLGAFLQNCPRDLPLAVETRNPGYLDETYFRFLREHDVHHVFCHGYYMPPAWEIEERFAAWLTGTVVVRLMGTDRRGIESRSRDDWSRVIEPKDDELKRIAAMVMRLRKRRTTVYVNVNNHYEGSAPLTIRRLQELL